MGIIGWLSGPDSVEGQMEFVTRSGNSLTIGDKQFYFVGANVYYLMESVARGDTSTVDALFSTAQELGLTVIRTATL